MSTRWQGLAISEAFNGLRGGMNWDDTRFFLALAREGTLSAAARVLDTRHTTVARRIQSLEERCGATLFVSTPDGYQLTEHGERALQVALEAEGHLLALERTLQGSSDALTGQLRVVMADVLVGMLANTLRACRKLYPDIELSVLVGHDVSMLHRREADLAICITPTPPEHLVGRRLMTLRYAAFGKRGEHDTWTQSPEQLPWIMWDERLDATERWFKRIAQGRPAAYRIDSAQALIALVCEGLGVGVLPTRVGRHHGLAQIGEHIEELDSEVWVLTHPDLRHAARIVAFMDTLRAHVDEVR
jgi:DNA-binding transcriptional LysR family regulator